MWNQNLFTHTYTYFDKSTGALFRQIRVMTWGYVPHHWPFVEKSTGDRSIEKRPVLQAFDIFIVISMHTLVEKQSIFR